MPADAIDTLGIVFVGGEVWALNSVAESVTHLDPGPI
jgi:hypothetical protein